MSIAIVTLIIQTLFTLIITLAGLYFNVIIRQLRKDIHDLENQLKDFGTFHVYEYRVAEIEKLQEKIEIRQEATEKRIGEFELSRNIVTQ